MCRSRAIAFKAIADGLPSDAALPARLVRAPYPATLMHELQLHAWNDVKADGTQFVVDLMDDAGALYEKASTKGQSRGMYHVLLGRARHHVLGTRFMSASPLVAVPSCRDISGSIRGIALFTLI